MESFREERAFAHKFLECWINKFKVQYIHNPQIVDAIVCRHILLEHANAEAKPSVLENTAAKVLYHIVNIEDSIETGEADDLINGVPILTLLVDGLYHYLSSLQKISGEVITNPPKHSAKSDEEIVSDGIISRRDKQLSVIKYVIDELGFDAQKIPNGGKAKVKELCKLKDKPLFSDEAFNHAWKVGRKLSLFKMANHDQYSS